ncbi:hypothetical protein GGR51DRAFT_552658 [Nemania sp. FL0031]|nr:hypothetical protein GGR51DRAFT_552658 [Nemania sp. FL0031]
MEAAPVEFIDIHNNCVVETRTPDAPLFNPCFLPRHRANDLLQEHRIRATLRDRFKDADEASLDDLVVYVTHKARDVFLTLVLAGKLKYIGPLRDGGFTDQHLPVGRDAEWEIFTLDDQHKHNCFSHEKWTPPRKNSFLKEQWAFLAPFFSADKFIYSLHPDHPLPFVMTGTVDSEQGHFGSVSKISISAGHHNYSEDGDENFELALKCLKDGSTNEDMDKFYEKEKQTLDLMRKLKHPHLIQAYAAYKRGNDKGFLFPWAERGNLRQFWVNSKFDLGSELLSWTMSQMIGLTHGIKQLHKENTRHGDIKPGNILVFPSNTNRWGILVLADVGLAKFHALYTHQRYTPTTTIHGSRRYEPPDFEPELDRYPEVEETMVPLSRKYDVWSLGCVFLEFIIWLLHGPDGFNSFFAHSNDNGAELRFWEQTPEGPQLRQVLTLIRTRLLIVKVNDRASTGEVLEQLESIGDKFSLQPVTYEIIQSKFHPQLVGLKRNLQLSNENRTSKLRNAWKVVVDNDLALSIVSKLWWSSLPFIDRRSPICQNCKNINFGLERVSLNRTFDEIRSGSEGCKLCSLLSRCLSNSKIARNQRLQLFRSGSSMSFTQGGPCLVSIYGDPKSAPHNPPYTQIGLPELPSSNSRRFQLLREWVRLCDNTHQCNPRLESSAALARMPTRVIEVGLKDDKCVRLCETSNDWQGRYIALSHCWGNFSKNVNFCTKRDNFAAFRSHISFNRLPKTFQDAITVTRALDIPYLWIDSLCIIQDDEADWDSESKRMEDVYSSAYITIAATSSRSSYEGFLDTKPRRQASIDDFQNDVEERVLSRRTIHFASTQILAQLRNPQSQFLGDHDFPRSALAYFKNERILLVQYLHTVFSKLQVTKQTDRSVALLGLQKRLGRTLETRVNYGVVERYFHRSMLWCAAVECTLSPIHYPSDRLVPSWSWMAYLGEINYLEVPFGKVEWMNDLGSPFPGHSTRLPGEKVILAIARKHDFNWCQWLYIAVGKHQVPNKFGETRYYVLLVRPVQASSSRV